MARKEKILFVVEALTFAHVARSAILSQVLQAAGYEVHFACHQSPYVERLENELRGCRLSFLTHHVEYSEYIASMNRCESPYSTRMLQSYVNEELDLFGDIDPALVIGDLRYSLAISCPQANRYFVNLVNAIWSPFVKQELTYPDGWRLGQMGMGIGEFLFRIFSPFAFSNICRPFNTLRSRLGLPIFKDIFELHCAGDSNLYLDPPELFDAPDLPEHHRFIGPVLHSMDAALPDALTHAQPSKPIVFVTMGSSGAVDNLSLILKTLAQLPVFTVVATSGRANTIPQTESTLICDFLPAREVLGMSSLVVSNGGSPMSYLALSQGVPIVGVCSNMDQHLAAQSVTKFGAGVALRSQTLKERELKQVVENCLEKPTYRERAQICSRSLSFQKTSENFKEAIQNALYNPDGREAQNKNKRSAATRGEGYVY